MAQSLPPLEHPAAPPTLPAEGERSGRWLPLLAVTTGLLSVPLGLGLAAIGMGFANATASGTGMALVFVGVWTALAVRGLRSRRWQTLLGLSVAWLLLAGRIFFDFPATGMSLLLALFLLPLITLPLGVAWLLCSLAWVSAIWFRGIKLARNRTPATRRAENSAAASAAPPVPSFLSGVTLEERRRGPLGMGVRLCVLVVLMAGIPSLVWSDRAGKLDKLAQEYAREDAFTNAQPVTWGACTTTFLGYSLTEKIKKDPGSPVLALNTTSNVVADAAAEVESLSLAGAEYIRVGASGDQLLAEKPWQEAVDDAFISKVRSTGRKLVLVDTQHPKVTRDRKLTWQEFGDWHLRRLEYYQQRYHPSVYLVVCEPLSYHGFVLKKSETFSAEAWAKQLSAACRRIKELAPDTQTGICLLVMEDKRPEWEVWQAMRDLPELDILSVEIYQPEDFGLAERRLVEFGHPRDFQKDFWIAETFNGWALAGDRRWTDDARWLRIADAFAARNRAETVLVWAFGTFIEGGSFYEFFRSGHMSHRWQNKELSLVGRTFADLAGKTER